MPQSHREAGRAHDEMRPLVFRTDIPSHAEGCVQVSFGGTTVLCTASVTDGVPRFLRDKNQGWLTAEYGMLPRSTHSRTDREAARGKQTGRTQEIQRLIGRSLRQALDLRALGDRTIIVDCDVLRADGGTRTAAISGGYVALVLALRQLQYEKKLLKDPLLHSIAAVSVGLVQDQCLLDLNYQEDVRAGTDMNVVMTASGLLIEVQGTAEEAPFQPAQLTEMLELATQGIQAITAAQQAALGLA